MKLLSFLVNFVLIFHSAVGDSRLGSRSAGRGHEDDMPRDLVGGGYLEDRGSHGPHGYEGTPRDSVGYDDISQGPEGHHRDMSPYFESGVDKENLLSRPGIDMKSVLKAQPESSVSTRLGAPSLAAELANSHVGDSFDHRDLAVHTPGERRTDEVYEDRTRRQGHLRTRPKADVDEGRYNEVYEGRYDSYEDEAPSESFEEEAPSESYGEEAPSESYEEEAPSESYEEEAPSESYEEEALSESYEEESPSESYEDEGRYDEAYGGRFDSYEDVDMPRYFDGDVDMPRDSGDEDMPRYFDGDDVDMLRDFDGDEDMPRDFDGDVDMPRDSGDEDMPRYFDGDDVDMLRDFDGDEDSGDEDEVSFSSDGDYEDEMSPSSASEEGEPRVYSSFEYEGDEPRVYSYPEYRNSTMRDANDNMPRSSLSPRSTTSIRWKRIGGLVTEMAVSGDGSMAWGVGTDKNIYYCTKAKGWGKWSRLDTKAVYPALQVSTNRDGTNIWVVNTKGQVWQRGGIKGSWKQVDPKSKLKMKSVSITADAGIAWGVATDRKIYYREKGFSGSWTSDSRNGRADQISISGDGSDVWVSTGTGSKNGVYHRYGIKGSWKLKGHMKYVSVSSDGNVVWGVRHDDRFYFRNGPDGKWKVVNGMARLVCSSEYGKVVFHANHLKKIWYSDNVNYGFNPEAGHKKKIVAPPNDDESNDDDPNECPHHGSLCPLKCLEDKFEFPGSGNDLFGMPTKKKGISNLMELVNSFITEGSDGTTDGEESGTKNGKKRKETKKKGSQSFLLPAVFSGEKGDKIQESEQVGDACQHLTFFSEPVIGFAYENTGKGLCFAMDPCSNTYGVAQSGILPGIPIGKPPIGEITLDSIGFSLDKKLMQKSHMKFWDGKQREVYGHVSITGTATLGIELGTWLTLEQPLDADLIIDMDPMGNGIVPMDGMVDFRFMVSGKTGTPALVIDMGSGNTFTVDLPTPTGEFKGDLYVAVEGKNGKDTEIQFAQSLTMPLTSICNVAPMLLLFCALFDEKAEVEGQTHVMATGGGKWGLRFRLKGKLDWKGDALDELLGTPSADFTISLEKTGKKFEPCITFNGKKHCLNYCTKDSQCGHGYTCTGEKIFQMGWCERLKKDGKHCFHYTECLSKKCTGWNNFPPGFKCGIEPKWKDGTKCLAGTTCKQCENKSSYWYGKAFTACGKEPGWSDGKHCGAGTTCKACKNGSSYWYGKAFTACGKEPGWSDGKRCGAGTTCKACKNGSSYWYKKAFTACGKEPKWKDGTRCAKGTTCNACENKAHWWWSKAFTACGKPPCLKKGTSCADCSRCCNSWKVTWKGPKCK